MSEHDVDESHREPSSNVVIGRGIKILGETVVPGASLEGTTGTATSEA